MPEEARGSRRAAAKTSANVVPAARSNPVSQVTTRCSSASVRPVFPSAATSCGYTAASLVLKIRVARGTYRPAREPAATFSSLVPVSTPAVVLLSVLAAVVLGLLGSYCLSSVLVMGGRSAEWLESHRWIYPVVLGTGCAVLAVAVAVPLWPLGSLGAALALVAAGRYLWLNV